MPNPTSLPETLQRLNYLRTASALSIWKGKKPAIEPYRLYEDYEDFLTPDTLTKVDQTRDEKSRIRLRHAFIDHYLQQALLPHETEMQTWMHGAAAIVNDERVYFRNIIQWCQQSSTHADREHLQEETGPLCKFLKPFALNYWEILLEILHEELGFDSYIAYCGEKKGIDYKWFLSYLNQVLKETEEIYFKAMRTWTDNRFSLPLESLNRFDAINMLSLGEFNALLPVNALNRSKTFFEYWEIDLANVSGLHMDIKKTSRKSSQAMSFLLSIPGDIHLVMNPTGGWIDLETLWHELGHGLSAVNTSPRLSIVDRELATSFSLSESFAFLLQNITFSIPFLQRHLNIPHEPAVKLHRYKVLKDLSVFRRYAAKFIAEYRMFDRNTLSDGEPYARDMKLNTGFYHQPESHLFDLVPEFYCLDYLLGWMAEAVMEATLQNSFGEEWMFCPQTGDTLKQWWYQGNQSDIFEFFKKNNLGMLTADRLVKRWKDVLE